MKKLKTLLTAAAVAFTAMFSTAPAPQTAARALDTVKIMPIGDSITFGYGEDGGYRKYLDQALKAKEIPFDMVGPEGQNEASFNYNGQRVTYDNNHAGYSGYTIKQTYPIPSWGENGLLEVLQKKNAVKQAQPDIVLLIIGTNDMTANRDLSECSQSLHDLLDYIIGDMPSDSVIFLGSIPEFTAYGGNAQRVANYNNTVKQVAESYGDNVQFADVHGCLNGMADMASDKLHPTGAGYEKMGKFWAETIEAYLGNAIEPVDPDSPNVLNTDFENGLSGWTGRGSASVAVTQAEHAGGSNSAAVTNRDAAWNGISHTVNSTLCPAGTVVSAEAKVMQKSGETVHFKMTMQYGSGNDVVYDTFAEADVPSGEWVTISWPAYKVKEGSSPVLYIETDTSKCDFYLDDVAVNKTDANPQDPSVTYKKGDVDHSGKIENADVFALRDFLLGKEAEVYLDTADLDGSGSLTAKDLTLLKRMLLEKASQPDEPVQEHDTQYMSKIRDQITASVPQNLLRGAEGKLEHITYFSKKANRNKGANVWLPPGYDANEKYPVFFVNHGYGGDEGSMTSGMGVLEIATNLIKSGDAVPMIIVFTNQYTDPSHEKQTGNGQADVPGYDNFVEDFPDSLLPYIEEHYPVKKGRENTGIAGFSMGGREALYIGMKCADKVGYIGGGAPAPGIFPTQDQFMNHPGVMSKDDMRIDPPYSPYLLLIAGGTSDNMVNDFPEQYHKLFDEHGTDNIFLPVPGGGHDSSTIIPMMYNLIRFMFKA